MTRTILSLASLLLVLPLLPGCAKNSSEASRSTLAPPETLAESPRADNLFVNPGFETGDSAFSPWSINMHADSEAFAFALESQVVREGKHSIRVERQRDEPFANIVQYFHRPDITHRRYRISAWLRGDALTSPVYLHVIPFVMGAQSGLHDNRDEGLSGTFDWTRLTMDVELPERVDRMEAGVTTTGDGTLWIDDIELTPLD